MKSKSGQHLALRTHDLNQAFTLCLYVLLQAAITLKHHQLLPPNIHRLHSTGVAGSIVVSVGPVTERLASSPDGRFLQLAQGKKSDTVKICNFAPEQGSYPLFPGRPSL
jgi:hypothetical protein